MCYHQLEQRDTIENMKTLVINKRASFNYELLEKMEAGLMLLGTEVKSARAGNMSLRGSFVTFRGDEAYLTNATIPPWQIKNAPDNYDPERPRKLLLKKSDLKHLLGSKRAKGLTIVPIRVYTKGPRLKLEIALARGKGRRSKKQILRERDIKRDVDRIIRGKE